MTELSLYSVVVSGAELEKRANGTIVAHFTNKTAAREYAREAANRGLTVEWFTEGAALNSTAARAIDFLNVFSDRL